MFPFLPKTMRLQRWCLTDLAKELTEKRGFDVIVDFASGLPTNDHIHLSVPTGTTVIYSDWDPVVVEYGREILKDVPNTYFFHADARHPEELLNRPEVTDILKGRRDIALVSWGLAAFIADEDIIHAAQFLSDWADKKSVWAFNAQAANVDTEDPGIKKVMQILQRYGRQDDLSEQWINTSELVKPWHPETDFIPFIEWHDFDKSFMSDEELNAAGPSGGGYGAYLVK